MFIIPKEANNGHKSKKPEKIKISAGTIPGTLGDLQQLILLDLSSNRFSGTLDDYAYETSTGQNDLYSILRYLNISNNDLLGTRSPSEHTNARAGVKSLCL